ncbi:hypothetical protein U9M48_028401, partial [Paspalum notatum var. saurae]
DEISTSSNTTSHSAKATVLSSVAAKATGNIMQVSVQQKLRCRGFLFFFCSRWDSSMPGNKH